MLAAIRPDSWNFPLFLHVLGAMILVGGLFTGGFALALARGNERLLRLGYRSLLAIGLPGYILMRIGAEWTADKEGFNEEGAPDPAWLGIGYVTADIGALLFLIALIVGGIGVYRLRKGGGVGLLKASMVISLVLLAAYVVAVWAMSAKPD
jgi:cytochrome bd-type quinol oxidase subunit 1